jgi:hypothetical protein
MNAIKDISAEVAALGRMTVAQLRERYQQLHGEPTTSSNRDFLIKRLAWRIQSLAEGGLSERARRRAEELARDADLRTTVPKPPKASGEGTTVTLAAPMKANCHDLLPGPGTVLTRMYRGRRISVTVQRQGFEHDGQTYRSLSAIAKHVTGSHWNGHLFFGLRNNSKKGGNP